MESQVAKSHSKTLFYLLKLDFFSEHISFNYNESKRINSTVGMLLTMIVVFLSASLCIVFGKDTYYKTTPTVSQTQNYLENSIVTKNNLFFFFRFQLYGGTIFDKAFDYLKFVHRRLYYEDAALVKVTEEDVVFENCNDSHFKSLGDKLSIGSIDYSQYVNRYYCIKFPDDFYVYNPYGYSNSILNAFMIKSCQSETSVCPDDMQIKLSEIYLDFYYLDNYVDSLDYVNPIKYYFNSFLEQLTNEFQKRSYISFINVVYTSDNGWLLENKEKIEFASFNSKTQQVNALANNNLYILAVDSPRVTTKYFRTYLKVQDMFAKVGGFINGLIIALRILSIDYFEYCYLLSICDLINYEKHKHNKILLTQNKNKLNDNRLIHLAPLDPNKLSDMKKREMTRDEEIGYKDDVNNENKDNYQYNINFFDNRHEHNQYNNASKDNFINKNIIDLLKPQGVQDKNNIKEELNLHKLCKDSNSNKMHYASINDNSNLYSIKKINNYINNPHSNNNIRKYNSFTNGDDRACKNITNNLNNINFGNAHVNSDAQNILDHFNANNTNHDLQLNRERNMFSSKSKINHEDNHVNSSRNNNIAVYNSLNAINMNLGNQILHHIKDHKFKSFTSISNKMPDFEHIVVKNDSNETLKISTSILCYLKFRLSYVFCCMNQQRKYYINKVKDDTLDFTSIQKEIRNKLSYKDN